MIGVMIENRDAMKQIDEIMAVEGLDFVLFGPADYSMSIGLGAPDVRHPEVADALAKTIEAARSEGKHVSLNVSTDRAAIETYIGLGITMLELGNDLSLLRAEWERGLRDVADILAGAHR